ncbi:RNA polymerase II transcription factor B subunit 4 [Linnemannia exigua]|uniref:General transcription and DNA repair factor IIH subunit TFB4 n=1 Tax=Linnemannia exigua TaxID=604196 RepID=A0AAD4DD36_9FUNG|nr:RNA polymerase II transcription factor B subunit 4 [Linnemannia exigua]
MKDISTSEDDSNLLVMVIDTNPFEWEHPSAPLKLNEALQHILAFMNAHLAGRHDNKLAVIASHVGVSKFLYPTPNETIPGGKVQTKKDANAYQSFKIVNDAVLAGITRLLQDPRPTLEEKDLGSSKIAASLSLGLCYINQVLKLDALGHIKPRMLVLTVSPDSSSDYIPIMNCIFSAQKANIPIDVCKIWGEDAVFLQQAAHITEGIYMRPNDPRGLLQVLMVFCIDLDLSMDEQFMIGEKSNDTRVNRTKQVLKWFIAQKSKWNAEHEFAVIILGEKAVWHVDFTTDIVLLEHAVDELYTMGKFSSFDMSEQDGPTVRAIMIYTRSDVLPTLPDKEFLDNLHATGRFYFDCVYIHNKASEVAGDVKPQQIYDRLTEMESANSPGYFYELTRVLKKFSGAMGELLANPAIRAIQEGGFPKMLPPPSLRPKQETIDQSMNSPQKQQAAPSSPSVKRTEMAGVSPSSTFFGGAAVSATVLPTTLTGSSNGGNGGVGTRSPPHPPSHSAAAGSTSPFGASPPRFRTEPSSQVGSRSGSVAGMRAPPSGPGGPGGGAAGGSASGGAVTGGGSGTGTGMDDAILI